jgi:hypothetical protein
VGELFSGILIGSATRKDKTLRRSSCCIDQSRFKYFIHGGKNVSINLKAAHMAATVYALCTLISIVCSVLLIKSYLATRFRLLFWSGLCFIGVAFNNVLLIFDKLIVPEASLTTVRLTVSLLSLLPLMYGLILEE